MEPTQIPTTEFGIISTNDTMSNRGRSSSLSDLDTSPVEDPTLIAKSQTQLDMDSEAETEKVDDSPEKAAKLTNITINSTSETLRDPGSAQAIVAEPTADAASSDSEISSRSASPTDPLSAGFAESLATSLERQASPRKRKRESDDEVQDRRLRQRTGSTHSSSSQELEKTDEDPLEENLDQDERDGEKVDAERNQINVRAKKAKIVEARATKKSRRLNPPENQSNEEDENGSTELLAEASHLSSEGEEVGEAEEDPEVAARNEAEGMLIVLDILVPADFAFFTAEKHIAARASLAELEKQFAVLRDKYV